MQRCAGDGCFEFRSNNLHPAGRFNGIEVDPTLARIAHLSHALRSLEALDVGREGTVLTCEHDGVADA